MHEAGLAPAALDPGDRLVPAVARVRDARRETYDTVTLELARDGRSQSIGFEAGQFNMLYAFGVGEVPISMSGDPARSDRWVHTVRAVGAVSHALSALEPGGAVGVRGPFGTGWPITEAEGTDLVIVAGGIGLAPLRPAVYRALARRERYGRIVLLYGARSPADLLYRGELEAWGRRSGVAVDVTVDSATNGWTGHVGVVTELVRTAAFDPSDATALVCGPEVMMRFAVHELLDRGLAADRIHLSMERNMKCAAGHCGRCQFGPDFVCKDGPVFPYPRVARRLALPEV